MPVKKKLPVECDCKHKKNCRCHSVLQQKYMTIELCQFFLSRKSCILLQFDYYSTINQFT